MLIAHVMVGAPGSGKSTAGARLAELFDSVVVSTDAVRGDLWGDESVQGDWADVSREVERRVRCAAAGGRNVVLDATHAKRSYRRHAAEMLRAAGYDVVVPVLAHPPLETCLERNAGRDRVVPADVVERMWLSIEQNKQSIQEDFNK